MDPNQKPVASQPKLNIWLIVSIVLAVALVGVLAANFVGGKKGGADSEFVIVDKNQASDSLIDFINKVYGAQVGTAALKESNEQNGLYKVDLTVTDANGQNIDQTVFLSQDGKLFIPQVIDIAQVSTQFDALQQQQQPAVNANTNASSEVPAEESTPAAENTNVAE